GDCPRGVTAGEWVHYKITGVRQELDEEPRKLGRETGRMNLRSHGFTPTDVRGVRLVIAALNDVRRDGTALIGREGVLDGVATRPSCGLDASADQPLHVWAVRLQDL